MQCSKWTYACLVRSLALQRDVTVGKRSLLLLQHIVGADIISFYHYGEYGQWVTPTLYFMARLKPVRYNLSSKPLTDRLVTSWTAIHVNGDSTSNANRVVSVLWSAGANALLSLARWLADNDSTTVTLFLLENWLTHRGNRKHPIRHKIWHPVGSGFGRKVEIWPDLDSWIGYPSIPSSVFLVLGLFSF